MNKQIIIILLLSQAFYLSYNHGMHNPLFLLSNHGRAQEPVRRVPVVRRAIADLTIDAPPRYEEFARIMPSATTAQQEEHSFLLYLLCGYSTSDGSEVTGGPQI